MTMTIGDYFFELDTTNHNIHVYKNKEYFDIIRTFDDMPIDVFKQKCKEWINKNM